MQDAFWDSPDWMPLERCVRQVAQSGGWVQETDTAYIAKLAEGWWVVLVRQQGGRIWVIAPRATPAPAGPWPAFGEAAAEARAWLAAAQLPEAGPVESPLPG